MSASGKGILKPWVSAALLGIQLSEKTKAKLSASKIGKYNGKNQPHAIIIEVKDLETNTTTTYNSIGEAARALNIARSRISMYFNRNQIKPINGRYVFRKL